MSLKKKIISKMRSHGVQLSMLDIYGMFPEEVKTTVRGRVYNGLGKGITRVGRGLYISTDAIIEHGDTMEIIDRMLYEGDTFDFIFLDIPYKGAGQRGGNRNLFDKSKISPEQFGSFIQKVEKLLKTDTSPLAFMFTTGKESKRAHDKYMQQFEGTGLKMCERTGTYMKLWPNGNRMNMGKYLMPIENIYFFSKSGMINDYENYTFDFRLAPKTREYPTAKPYEMIKTIVGQATQIGDWVFDPFGGSGKVLKACIELKRKCHTIDLSGESINNHILPLI